MATKEQLYSIIAAYGLGRALPAGSTRAAAKAATSAMVKAGRVVVPAVGRASARAAPPLARGAATLARRNPYVAAGALGYGAYEAGLLDPFLEPVAEAIEEEVVVPIKKSGKRTRSKFNKAVSAGMKAVRASKSYGKKGTINNAKRAFSAVTKVASKVNKGKKVSAKGVTGTIARAVRRII
tara:strand:- start:440 stop:982 length:543 start_codon:yes stop_codon:yes gene_type:complete